jgi:hypothetical protein
MSGEVMKIQVTNSRIETNTERGKPLGRGELVLLPGGKLYFDGKGGMKTTDLTQSNSLSHPGGRDLCWQLVYMRPGDYASLEIVNLTFQCASKQDALNFYKAWQNEHFQKSAREALQSRIAQWRSAFLTALMTECKAIGRVDLLQFIHQHLHEVRFIEQNQSLTAEAYLPKLESILAGEILAGKLSGVLDKQKHFYIDRDFLVREQRVVTIQMDFNQLLAQLGDKGIALTSIQCPQCGGSCDIPDSGSIFTCRYCKASIHALDVFEKFKSILDTGPTRQPPSSPLADEAKGNPPQPQASACPSCGAAVSASIKFCTNCGHALR